MCAFFFRAAALVRALDRAHNVRVSIRMQKFGVRVHVHAVRRCAVARSLQDFAWSAAARVARRELVSAASSVFVRAVLVR